MKSDMSPLSSKYMETSSSGYRRKGQNSSFQSRLESDMTSDILSTGQSRKTFQSSQGGRENIKLVPMKYKDLMEVFQSSPQYKDKSPIMIKMKESEIDKLIEKQHYQNSLNSAQPQRSLQKSTQLSPMSLKKPVERDYGYERQYFEPEYTTPNEQTSRSDSHRSKRESKPPLGENQAQVYAMTGIQAYPMVGGNGSAFKAKKSRKRTSRKKSRRKASRKPKSRSRSRGFRSKSRGRSKRQRSPRRKKRMTVRSSRRTPRARSARSTVIVRRKRRPVSRRIRVSSLKNRQYCTPFPLCDYDCTPLTARSQSPYRRSSRPMIGQNTARGMACNCTVCQEKLQFIQPGVCSQKKNMWTNEYAIIPKPQVNLIDPCKELDPSIYPRADRPCIRDGRGNPLTDCIGRPLRDPIGKRFLNFNANGSVMDTNFRGNFFTGQPPLCVKCPMPGSSCAPDTTHNWWMSCGYPVKANMSPFFNNVVANENAQRRC